MRFILTFVLLALSPAVALPQGLSLVFPSAVTPPGSSATVNVVLTNSTTTGAPGLAALQFSFTAPADAGQVTMVAGPALTAAGKSISCNIPAPAVPPATITGICVAWGVNSNLIGDGVVAIATVPVLATAKLTSEPIGLLLGLATDVSASASIIVPSMGGSFQVFSFCDLNRDGVTDILDVNVVVAQVIAGAAACNTGDISKDGKCTIVDVFRTVLAALPTSTTNPVAGVCKVGP